MFYSPLRYPGGKSKLSKFVSQICLDNTVNGHYIEPYAGGASVALYLLIEGHVSKISINDLDRSIYAFWYSILNYTEKFCNLIENTNIDIETWHKLKLIQKNKETADLFSLGFSTFYLNRTNRSGIIDAGVIGGLGQNGNYKIDCRFNKQTLISRIRKIAKHKKNIKIYNLDALKLIDKIAKKSSLKNTIYYFDPPYYLKGPSLYINAYEHDDHLAVAKRIKKIENAHWIVSYDNIEEIKKIYSGLKSSEFLLYYSAGEKKRGKEVIFFSPTLNLAPNLLKSL